MKVEDGRPTAPWTRPEHRHMSASACRWDFHGAMKGQYVEWCFMCRSWLETYGRIYPPFE